MSLKVDRADAKRESFPRVSGDEPIKEKTIINVGKFSPRERG